MKTKTWKARHWQILWEILAHLVSAVLLVFFFVKPSFKLLGWFLVAEYVTESVAAVSYYLWVRKVEDNHHDT